MNIKKWIKQNTTSMEGKTVVITGAVGGLGSEVTPILAKLGAHLVLPCLTLEEGEQFKEKLLKKYKKAKIDILQLNLADVESVKACVKEIKKYKGIDALINNAGVLNIPLNKTATGMNAVFQINFLSQYYLIKELLPDLRKKPNSVCVATCSLAHSYGKLDEADLDYSTRQNGEQVYGNSKRFLMYSLFELFKKEKKVKLSIVHPGITLTNMQDNYPKEMLAKIRENMKAKYPAPNQACLSIVAGVFSSTEYHEWIGPEIEDVFGFPAKRKLTSATVEESKRIFELAEKMYKDMKSL